MRDIDIAKEGLKGHSICLCKDGQVITRDDKGISPMVELIGEGADLTGYSVSDLIVGKAAAMLFVLSGISCVHAVVLSQSGEDYLKSHNIEYTYDTLTERIINRMGTGACPMETAVENIDDPKEGYEAIVKKREELRNKLTK